MATSASTGLIGVVRSTFRKLNALAEAMDRTPYADRVSRLEQELTQLKKEGRCVRWFVKLVRAAHALG